MENSKVTVYYYIHVMYLKVKFIAVFHKYIEWLHVMKTLYVTLE